MVEARVGALRAVADRVDALALDTLVIDRLHRHGLRDIPVAVVELEDEVAAELAAAGLDEHRVARDGCVFLLLRGACRGNVDVHRLVVLRRRGELHRIGVGGLALLVHHRAAVAFLDDHLAALRARHVQVDSGRKQPVVHRVGSGGAHLVVDDAAPAFEVLADDRAVGHVAGDVKGIVAQAADNGGDDVAVGAQDGEVVVALQAVDFDRLDVLVADVQPGAEHALVGDHEVVGELGADDDHLVEAGAAVEIDRRVDVVLDGVGAFAADRLGGVLGRDSGAAHQRKRADDEVVVAVVAFEPQLGLVAVDGELVVTRAAVGGKGERCAAAQEPGGRRHGKELVARRDACGMAAIRHRDARRAVDLADLEGVVARAAVERGDGCVVVDSEVVVAGEAAHDEPRVRVLVVVDALDVLPPRPQIGIAHVGERSMEQCNERRRVRRERARRPLGDRAHPAQQEDVVVASAFDGQRVETVVLRAGIEHVDDVVVLARRFAAVRVDDVSIRAAAAVEVQGIAYGNAAVRTIVGRLQRRHVVDDDQVVAAGQAVGVAQNSRPADDQLRPYDDRVALPLAGDLAVCRGQSAFDLDERRLGVGVFPEVVRVAVNGDAHARMDLAAGLQVDVVAHAQQHEPGRRIDRRLRVHDQVFARIGRVAHGEPGIAGCREHRAHV